MALNQKGKIFYSIRGRLKDAMKTGSLGLSLGQGRKDVKSVSPRQNHNEYFCIIFLYFCIIRNHGSVQWLENCNLNVPFLEFSKELEPERFRLVTFLLFSPVPRASRPCRANPKSPRLK